MGLEFYQLHPRFLLWHQKVSVLIVMVYLPKKDPLSSHPCQQIHKTASTLHDPQGNMPAKWKTVHACVNSLRQARNIQRAREEHPQPILLWLGHHPVMDRTSNNTFTFWQCLHMQHGETGFSITEDHVTLRKINRCFVPSNAGEKVLYLGPESKNAEMKRLFLFLYPYTPNMI